MDYGRVYQELHEQHPKWFNGASIIRHVAAIAHLVFRTDAQRLLDYGSGKGAAYLRDRVHEQWGGPLPHCYDPGVRYLAERPAGKFDGIICCDVMEHIEEQDVDAVLADIFQFMEEGFVFFSIACRPSKKQLPDGRDCHLTIRPPEWWAEKLEPFRRPFLIIEAVYDTGAQLG